MKDLPNSLWILIVMVQVILSMLVHRERETSLLKQRAPKEAVKKK